MIAPILCAVLAQKQPVDPAATAALKSLFVSASALTNAHVVITRSARSSGDWYIPQLTEDLWLGPKGHFRLESVNNMGDMSAVVCDGLSVMTDPLADDDPIRLSRAGKPLHELASREPLTYFLDGAYDALVDKDSPPAFVPNGGSLKSIELRSKDLGKIVVTYREDPGAPLPEEIDLYRSSRRRDEGTEGSTPYTRERIAIVSVGAINPQLFLVMPPKGKKVEDERGKVAAKG